MLLQRLKNQYLSRTVVFAMDLVLSTLASILVIVATDIILGHLQISPLNEPRIKFAYILLAAISSGIAFVLIHTYRIVIRRLSAKDLIAFGLASALKGVFLVVAALLADRYTNPLLMLIGLDVLVTFAVLIFVRVLMILVWEFFNHRIQEKYEYKRVMVYGTSDKSVATIMRLQNSPHYKVIGFLDQGADGRTIESLPVFSAKSEKAMEKILLDNRIDAILFPTEKEAQAEEDHLIHFCSLKNIKCLIVPSVDEVVEGEAILRPREIKVEDLLGRDEIKISMDAIQNNFRGQTVLVTGAAGSIGSELCRQLAGFGVGKLILFDNAETPIRCGWSWKTASRN